MSSCLGVNFHVTDIIYSFLVATFSLFATLFNLQLPYNCSAEVLVLWLL